MEARIEAARGRPSAHDPAIPAVGSLITFAPELRLRFQRLLGEGGMGVVYLVQDEVLGRPAAVKTIKDPDPKRARRFRRESSVTARLDHPGVPPIYASGETDGRPYLVMRFIDGGSLAAEIDRVHGRGRPDAAAVRPLLHVLVKVAEVVAYAHSRGVVHRDLKPENVMVGAFGEVLVMDWGIARILAESHERDSQQLHEMGHGLPGLTRAGAVLGTPAYIAPEQARGETVDERADVFSIGAILMEILTGRPPYVGSLLEVLALASRGRAPSPRELQPGVAPELDAIVRRATAPDPKDRYSGAAQLGSDLQAWLEDRPVSVHVPGPWSRARTAVARHPTSFAVMGSMLLLSALGFVLIESARRAERARGVESARLAHEDARRRAEEAGAGRGEDPLAARISALAAAQSWHLQARDAASAAARFEAGVALGGLALEREQWDLARHGFEAARIGVDDARIAASLAAVESALSARPERRRREVARLIERLLERPTTDHAAAVMELLRNDHPETVSTLCGHLDRVADALDRAEATLLLSVTSDPRERGSLERAIASRRSLLPEEDLPREALLSIRAAEARVVELERARAGSALSRSYSMVAGAQQRLEVGVERIDLSLLIADALSWMRSPGPTIASLGRYLRAEADWQRAARVAAVLCRIGTSPAIELVHRARRERHGEESAFSRAIATRLARARGDEAGRSLDLDAAGEEELLRACRSLRAESRQIEARRVAERLVSRWPGSAGGWAELGRVLSALGDRRAREPLLRALELDRDAPEVLVDLAAAQLELGEHRQAELAVSRALALAPELARAYHVRARLSTDPAQAVIDCGRCLELDPTYSPARFLRAWLTYHLLGDEWAARRDLELAVEQFPEDAEAWLHLGELHLWSARHDEARRDFERARTLAPGDSRPLVELGQLCLLVGDVAGAAESSERALRLHSDDARCWLLRGQVHQARKEEKPALTAFSRALALSPLLPEALLSRARLLARVAPPAALADLDTLARLRPPSFEGLLLRAELRLASRDVEGGRADLERALGIAAARAEWLGLLAARSLELGQEELATRAADAALELSPLEDRARAVKRALEQRRRD